MSSSRCAVKKSFFVFGFLRSCPKRSGEEGQSQKLLFKWMLQIIYACECLCSSVILK